MITIVATGAQTCLRQAHYREVHRAKDEKAWWQQAGHYGQANAPVCPQPAEADISPSGDPLRTTQIEFCCDAQCATIGTHIKRREVMPLLGGAGCGRSRCARQPSGSIPVFYGLVSVSLPHLGWNRFGRDCVSKATLMVGTSSLIPVGRNVITGD
jgi:hypothetical protein